MIRSTPDQLEEALFERTKDAFSRHEEISRCISEVVDGLREMSGEAIYRFMENLLADKGREDRMS